MTHAPSTRSPISGIWLILLLVAVAGPVLADERPPIVITDPSANRYRVAVQEFARLEPTTPRNLVTALDASIRRSLEFSGVFVPLKREAYLGPVTSDPLHQSRPVVCPNWSQIGTDALVQGEIEQRATDLRVEFRVIDVARGCRAQLRKRYRTAPDELDRIGKAIADDVVKAFTGRAGVADTEISFVSNRSGAKEIWAMDADGGNLRAVTRNRSINAFPDWSPAGDAIVYTSYHYRVRPHIFLLTRGRPSPGRILRGLGSRRPLYRAVFDPSGDRLALVMSEDGAAEIYSIGVDGRGLRRLTRHRAIDVSPTWSPKGDRLAFVSDRTGSPQVYVMNRDGGDQRRLTFNGSYNTAPSWSPDGRWIAYESRAKGQLDIWLIDPEGQVNVPLVSHPRSDESPSWAPDSRTVVFSSTRRGLADIYAVDLNGENLRRLTQGGGDDTSPVWGPYRR